ncbi:MAG: hypothetical protein R3Y56_05315 [Akkermansia sp.]
MGAKDQCPECGYCLPQAEALLGYGLVDFPRVLDAAGVLSHDECLQLTQFLEKLERKIRPVALCVYITDRGQREELAMHAHWILNHAQINHKAFGRRDRRLAIEESKMQMDFAHKETDSAEPLSPASPAAQTMPEGEEELPTIEPPRRHQRRHRFFARLRELYDQVFYPTPPPVEKEWMLVLVMDVQLGRALFSWGYHLDAYINGEDVSALIPCANMQFRNKDVMGGIKRVMRRVTRHVAGRALDVNAMIRHDKRHQFQEQMKKAAQEAKEMATHAAPLLIASLFLAAGELSHAQDAPTLTPLPTVAPTEFEGSPASETSFPTWSSQELLLLQQGQMAKSSRALFAVPRAFAPAPPPAPPAEKISEKDKKSTKKKSGKEERNQAAEDAEVAAPMLPSLSPWMAPSPALDGAHFVDEQNMLSEMEARDIQRQLALLNANKNYHLYLCVMDGTRGQTPEFSAAAYLPLMVEMGQQALLIQYIYGGQSSIAISGQGLSLSAEALASWQEQLNARAAHYINARDAIMIACQQASELLVAQTEHMREGGVDDTLYLPQIQLGVEGVDAAKAPEVAKESAKDKIVAEAGMWLPYLLSMLSCVLCTVGYLILRRWTRRKAQLLETVLDRRLSAEFGSGVSPSILYQEKYNKKRQAQELDEIS